MALGGESSPGPRCGGEAGCPRVLSAGWAGGAHLQSPGARAVQRALLSSSQLGRAHRTHPRIPKEPRWSIQVPPSVPSSPGASSSARTHLSTTWMGVSGPSEPCSTLRAGSLWQRRELPTLRPARSAGRDLQGSRNRPKLCLPVGRAAFLHVQLCT